MSGTEHCIVERDGATVFVTMNRPEAKNALSPAMLVGLAEAWVEIDEDAEVRCAILTGAGGNFCTGMDLKSFAADGGENPYRDRFEADPDLAWKALLRHYQPTKPLIAAVEGYAVAGGTEIVQACDIRVAGRSAVFGIFEPRRGLFPVAGSTVRLRRQIPFAKAMDILLTGREVPADEAERIGLVTRVVDDGQALAEARRTAAMICDNGPLAVEAIKRSVRETEGLPEAEALAREFEIGWPVFATEDAKEGARAFAEKRTPNFRRR